MGANKRHGTSISWLRNELRQWANLVDNLRLWLWFLLLLGLGLGGEKPGTKASSWSDTCWLDAGRLNTSRLNTVCLVVPLQGIWSRIGRLDNSRAYIATKGEVKIRQHDVPILPNKDVLWLQITVYNTEHMQVFQCK
jgi:hypothetical protein